MIAEWPISLPRPNRDGFQLKPQEARRKRQSDAGPPGYRRRFSAVAKSVNMTLMLTHNQRATFDRFFHETCQDGAMRFWMPDPTNDGWPLTTETGAPLWTNDETREPLTIGARWLCAWGDDLPTETVQGIEFQKTFSLWVLP